VLALSDIKGVGAKTLEKLHTLNIYDIDSLVRFFPVNYIDMDSVSNLDEAGEGVFVLLNLKIIVVSKPFRRGKLSMFRAVGQGEDGKKVRLVWYNMPYMSKLIVQDREIRCFGKLRTQKGYELINPAFEQRECGESKFTGIKPLYPTKGHINQAVFSSIIRNALQDYQAESIISQATANKYRLMPLKDALISVHCPNMLLETAPALERAALEELVRRIAAYKLVKESGKREIFYHTSLDVVDEVSLPYTLTASQAQALSGISNIMLSDKPLNAMLTGDVGSGKTVVALLLAYFAVRAGYQAAVMAPTEILARQHHNTFNQLLEKYGVRAELLLGGMKAAEKRAALSRIERGNANIVIGTHAVISSGVRFANLAFLVIDEQHRFGVAERTALISKGITPDILTLSATPIPRSLRLTMFGDIDVFSIDRRFSASNIITATVEKGKRKGMLDYIAGECLKGKQAYIVAPRVYDDEGIECETAEGLYKELNKAYGKDIKISLLHGKMRPNEKQKSIDDFRENISSVLVATTVIEVGVDVPNASLMAIFGAERFGLASLHQLRGRIGRDGQKSYCFLYTEKEREDELVRLNILCAERNGLEIAEKDYELRGAGEWMGESQSGRAGYRPSVSLMKTAREVAQEIDLHAHAKELLQYAARLKLDRITLN